MTLAEAVRKAFGNLDILVINAGIADFRPIEQWDEAGFDRSVAINLKGPFFLVQVALPILANPASIVLTTSIQARIGMAVAAYMPRQRPGWCRWRSIRCRSSG